MDGALEGRNNLKLQIEEELIDQVQLYADKVRVAEGKPKLAPKEVERMARYMISKAKQQPYTLEEVRRINKKDDGITDNKRLLREMREAYDWREKFVEEIRVAPSDKSIDSSTGLIMGNVASQAEVARRAEEGSNKDAR